MDMERCFLLVNIKSISFSLPPSHVLILLVPLVISRHHLAWDRFPEWLNWTSHLTLPRLCLEEEGLEEVEKGPQWSR